MAKTGGKGGRDRSAPAARGGVRGCLVWCAVGAIVWAAAAAANTVFAAAGLSVQIWPATVAVSALKWAGTLVFAVGLWLLWPRTEEKRRQLLCRVVLPTAAVTVAAAAARLAVRQASFGGVNTAGHIALFVLLALYLTGLRRGLAAGGPRRKKGRDALGRCAGLTAGLCWAAAAALGIMLAALAGLESGPAAQTLFTVSFYGSGAAEVLSAAGLAAVSLMRRKKELPAR